MKNEKGKKVVILYLLIAVAIAIVCGYNYYKSTNLPKEISITEKNIISNENVDDTNKFLGSEYAIKDNSLGNFDLRFLQLENEKNNKIYSPLSIKYTLGMLQEGAKGRTKEQITNIIGDYEPNKYYNSKNMSFANAFFIRDTYKQNVKPEFSDILMKNYNAEVLYDSFDSAQNINAWINNKTLNLIDDIISDDDIKELNFALINSLAIDMDWEDKFLAHNYLSTEYRHEKYVWYAPENLIFSNFENVENQVSGMGIIASINNYDIVNEIGEENIRQTVGTELKKYLEKNPDSYFMEGSSDIKSATEKYLDSYIEELNENYKNVTTNTDFAFYIDNDIKSFAKDLKEYDDVKLQYIAIMPENDALDKYIDDLDADKINNVIKNLKDLKSENFREGVITSISGYIPKFKFDYDLKLMDDLSDLGITDVFDREKSNLTGITDEEAYIGSAIHKANIEFTQDGIKAAATTMLGGMGAGSDFDYYYDVPVEDVDLTFNKPYMFIIRNKETEEVWFAGTVYEPLSKEEEPTTEEECLTEIIRPVYGNDYMEGNVESNL